MIITVYHCGSSLGWSAEFWFNTVPQDENWSPILAIFGDMGNENAQVNIFHWYIIECFIESF